jgi:uncharacterized protein YdeI (YjbR/CyaY-like superfamily)
MPTIDPRVDAYIAKSADFARPILTHLRALVHAGCPGVEETIKWRSPHFMFHGMLCSMAAFKQHCVFGFWNGELGLPAEMTAMGQFGRIEALSDLPADSRLIALVRKAARLNASGVKRPPRLKHPKQPIAVPDDLARALAKNARARATFDGFAPSHRREYLEWITEARTDTTRSRRVESAIEWMAEGKPRNWKYMPAPQNTSGKSGRQPRGVGSGRPAAASRSR